MFVPAYSVAIPYSPLPPQAVIPISASPIVMPMPMQFAQPVQPIPAPVAVQTPMVFPTTTIVQSAPYVPSPVIHGPIAMHPPRNPSPCYSRTPPQGDDGGAANMLLVQPQQVQATPSHLTININTPQQQPTPLRDHPQDVPNGNHPFITGAPVAVPAAMTSRTIQNPPNAGFSVHVTPLPGIPLHFGDQLFWPSPKR